MDVLKRLVCCPHGRQLVSVEVRSMLVRTSTIRACPTTRRQLIESDLQLDSRGHQSLASAAMQPLHQLRISPASASSGGQASQHLFLYWPGGQINLTAILALFMNSQ